MKALVFIGLKIAEVLGFGVVVGLFYGLGLIMREIPSYTEVDYPVWLHAIEGLGWILCSLFVIAVGVLLIIKNLEWADNLILWWKYR